MRRIILTVVVAAAAGYSLWSTLRNTEMVLVPDPRPKLDHVREAAEQIEADGEQRVLDVQERTDG